MSKKLLTPLLILAITALFISCEGPEGPQGPEGPAGPTGPQGPGVEQVTFLGDNANSCGHCHAEVTQTWGETGHHEAYDALVAEGDQNNLYCVQCHVTGFDATVAYGDTVVTTPGPDLYGFDDYWPPANADDSARVEDLKQVQCEACHGAMGPTIYDHQPIVTFETQEIAGVQMSMCAKCHEQVEEWHESGHGQVLATHGFTTMEEFNDEFNASGNPASTSTCWTCHTGEGFAGMYDATYATRPEMATLIGCPSCHDPHDNSIESQLRTEDPYSVVFDTLYAGVEYTMDGYGPAQLCAQCHHARRTNSNVMQMIAGTYNPLRFGPHGSPQMDAFIGAGAYEIPGYTYDRDHAHKTMVAEACVTCHMYSANPGTPTAVYGHTFDADLNTCTPCHGAQTSFDIDGFQTTIQGKMDELIALIGCDPDSLGYPAVTTVEEREAGYAYAFLNNDGSLGAHNPAYALSLLDNAIDYLSPINNKTDNPWAIK